MNAIPVAEDINHGSMVKAATTSATDYGDMSFEPYITGNSRPFVPDNYRSSPISPGSTLPPLALLAFWAPEDVSIHDIRNILKDWSGRGSHVDFRANETVPLTQGRFLGHGSMGSVYETTVRGHALAWKRIYYRRKIGPEEKKEIEILRKVSHQHIIKLAGSYTHGQFLGVLLHPVAVCDLATLLEDIEAYHKKAIEIPQQSRLRTLGYIRDSQDNMEHHDPIFLLSRIGCICRAIEYLHNQKIRHKDLKPSNILLSSNGLWLTDFGTATDFSMQTVSTTDNWERGTPKYFAPEVAEYEPNGRPIDVFALGCILLEMYTITQHKSLETLRQLRSARDRSFQANLAQITSWILETSSWTLMWDNSLRVVILLMLRESPGERPTISQVCTVLSNIEIYQNDRNPQSLFRNCCKEACVSVERLHEPPVKEETPKEEIIHAFRIDHELGSDPLSGRNCADPILHAPSLGFHNYSKEPFKMQQNVFTNTGIPAEYKSYNVAQLSPLATSFIPARSQECSATFCYPDQGIHDLSNTPNLNPLLWNPHSIQYEASGRPSMLAPHSTLYSLSHPQTQTSFTAHEDLAQQYPDTISSTPLLHSNPWESNSELREDLFAPLPSHPPYWGQDFSQAHELPQSSAMYNSFSSSISDTTAAEDPWHSDYPQYTDADEIDEPPIPKRRKRRTKRKKKTEVDTIPP